MTDPRVSGGARYAEDLDLEGQLYARLVRSPYPHARVLGIDTSAVVCVVLTPDDVQDLAGYGVQIEDETVRRSRAGCGRKCWKRQARLAPDSTCTPYPRRD